MHVLWVQDRFSSGDDESESRRSSAKRTTRKKRFVDTDEDDDSEGSLSRGGRGFDDSEDESANELPSEAESTDDDGMAFRKNRGNRRDKKKHSRNQVDESDNDTDTSGGGGNKEGAGGISFDTDPEYERALKKAFKKAFSMMDKDGSGYVTERELGMALRAMGRDATGKEIARTMKRADTNNDGKLSLAEFSRMMLRLIKTRRPGDLPQREREIRDAFDAFDADGGGTISRKEFQTVLVKSLGVRLDGAEIKALVRAIDEDGDGEVNYGEFVHLMRLVGGGRRSKGYNAKQVAREIKRLKPAAKAAVHKIVRGPVRDPSDYLSSFAGMPANFRPATLQRLDRSHAHSLEALLRPRLLAEGSSARDVFEVNLQLRSAKGVPIVDDAHSDAVL